MFLQITIKKKNQHQTELDSAFQLNVIIKWLHLKSLGLSLVKNGKTTLLILVLQLSVLSDMFISPIF